MGCESGRGIQPRTPVVTSEVPQPGEHRRVRHARWTQCKKILRAPKSAGGPGGGCSATTTSLSHRFCSFFSHMASRRLVLVPGASGDTPRSFPDRSDSGEDGDATQVAHHEVAPVDATAVELPSSPHTSVVDALELDLSVPAFDPMESNEEDEHETGVPTVPASGSVRESHGRRLVLVSNTVDVSRVEVVTEDAQPAVSQVGGSESESDTISVGASVGEAEVSETVVESPIAFERGRGFAEAFASLDAVDLKSIFKDRSHVIRPHSS